MGDGLNCDFQRVCTQGRKREHSSFRFVGCDKRSAGSRFLLPIGVPAFAAANLLYPTALISTERIFRPQSTNPSADFDASAMKFLHQLRDQSCPASLMAGS
jgi:hypothetical protein